VAPPGAGPIPVRSAREACHGRMGSVLHGAVAVLIAVSVGESGRASAGGPGDRLGLTAAGYFALHLTLSVLPER
jgi:hypothetical protein